MEEIQAEGDDTAEVEATPKKIALKVPTLFLGSNNSHQRNETSDGQNSNTSKKATRPMPASLKKKLEESKQTLTEDGESVINSKTAPGTMEEESSPGSQKKASRPMPAFARKKIEEATRQSLPSTATIEKEEITQVLKPMPASAKKASRPMPASAKNKLTETQKDTANDEDVNNLFHHIAETNKHVQEEEKDESESQPRKRPMPASIKKKLEESTAEAANENVAATKNKSEEIRTNSQAMQKRPMPASAKQKIEEISTQGEKNKTPSFPTGNRPMPASMRRKLEGSDKTETNLELEENQSLPPEGKKINILLGVGGIKFPTFKKPVPASAPNKLLDQQEPQVNEQERAVEEPEDQDMDNEGDSDFTPVSSRRGRSSISSKELLALVEEKFQCDICDTEYYSKFQLARHREGHFKVVDDSAQSLSQAKLKAPSLKKKKSVAPKKEYKYKDYCPVCQKRMSNTRKLNKHVSECKRKKLLRCKTCNKQCKSRAEFEEHTKNAHSEQDSKPILSSPPSPFSNHSEDSSTDSDGSGDNRPGGIVSSSVDGGNGNQRSKQVDSFKKKIASALSSLGNHTKDTKRKNDQIDEEKDSDDDAEPPKKKIILASDSNSRTKSGSTNVVSMPASVRKKLEEKAKEEQNKWSDLHDLECEVCHKVFSQRSNRERHERTVHAIENPRETSTSKPLATSAKETKVSSDTKTKPRQTLDTVPNEGKCPICSKFFPSRLRRHCRDVHKMKYAADVNGDTGDHTNSNTSSAAPPKSKSFKIYKTSTQKLKTKLSSKVAPSSSSRKVIINRHKRQESPKFDSDAEEPSPEPSPVPVKKLEKPSLPPKSENKSLQLHTSTTTSSSFQCGCCNETFEVKTDLSQHMKRYLPKHKRFFACNICSHMFSHEEDFILHAQFRHTDLTSGMVQSSSAEKSQHPKPPHSSADVKNKSESSSGNIKKQTSKPTVSTSFTRRTGRSSINDYIATMAVSCPEFSIKISQKEVRLAKSALKRLNSRSNSRPNNLNKRSRSLRTASPSAQISISLDEEEPEEPMDTYNDDYDNGPVENNDSVGVEESKIAITSAFSQRQSPRKRENTTTLPSSSNEDCRMPCSRCSEVFYSYEALRKHELYFHNVKTSKMCPICGIYPTKLSRHLLAHESKTVRCSCAPCGISFEDFGLLLKHNLKIHPGPAASAETGSNKSREDPNNLIKPVSAGRSSSNNRREKAMPASIKLAAEKTEISPETIQKEYDGRNNNGKHTEETPKPTKRPMPASVKAKLESQKNQQQENRIIMPTSTKPARPMPASVRAKMTQKSALSSSVPTTATSTYSDKSSVKSVSSGPPSSLPRSKAMPASAKKRILNKAEMKEVSSVPAPPSRRNRSPEPIDLCDNDDYGDLAVVKGRISASERKGVAGHDVVTLDEDDSDNEVTVSANSTGKKTSASSFSFNIADEIAEHNRAVQMTTGGGPAPTHTEYSSYNHSSPGRTMTTVFNCRLCSTKFDDLEGVRCHINDNHIEYGGDHTENLYEEVYEKTAVSSSLSRKRRSNVHYNKNYGHDGEEDYEAEEEVIVSRGTSSRPRTMIPFSFAKAEDSSYQGSDDAQSTPPLISHSIEESVADKLLYACKFCGQRKDTPGKIKQHITKSHPTLKGLHQDEVVTLEPGKELEFVPMLPGLSQTAVEGHGLNVQSLRCNSDEPQVEGPSMSTYKCKICQKQMDKMGSMAIHIHRSHPEVKSSGQEVATFIQEVHGNGDGAQLLNACPLDSQELLTELSTTAYACGFCVFQTNDENDFVAHYKKHAEVSPYQCQFCSAEFNENNLLSAHLAREHSDAPEFVNEEETEIGVEEMVGMDEISVSSSIRIQIEQPKMISLGRSFAEKVVSSPPLKAKKYRPGPASKKLKSNDQEKLTTFINENKEVAEDYHGNRAEVDEGENGAGGSSEEFEPEDEQPIALPMPNQERFSTLEEGASAGAD